MCFLTWKISKINIVIPWAHLSTKSVEICIEGIYAIVIPFPKQDWSNNKASLIEEVKESLKSFEIQWNIDKEKKQLSEDSQQQKKSYMDSIKEKILANLKIKLQNLHFRFEDNYKKSEYSMGLLIESICSSPDNQVI